MNNAALRLAPFASLLFEVSGDATRDDGLDQGLRDLYEGYNGGFYWGRALLIRPATSVGRTPSTVGVWNDQNLWKGLYGDICKDVVFFSEDAFGEQFGLRAGRVVKFDPETAQLTHVADSTLAWCEEVARDPDFYTGAPVLAAWEREHGRIGPGVRLMPKQLFMLGGAFHSTNMLSVGDEDGIRTRAQLWLFTRNLPDGQPIIFRSGD